MESEPARMEISVKHEKMITVPESQKEVVDFTTCDFCQKKIDPDTYAIEEVTVECQHGYSYGTDGGYVTDISFDICSDCFRNKLVKVLVEAGCSQPYIEKRDW